jgi:hypothetical protein
MITLLITPKKENRSNIPLVLFLVFALFLFPFTGNYAQKALLLEEFLEKEGENNTELVRSLIYDNGPAVLLKDSKIQILGDGFPQKISTEIGSFPTLKSGNDIFRTIKLLQVNLSSNSEKSALRLNMEELKGFSNLAYVFINSEIPLTSEEVEMMVTGFEEGDLILLFQVNSNF